MVEVLLSEKSGRQTTGAAKTNWLVRRVRILLCVSLAVTVCSYFAKAWWVADLVVNFRIQISIGVCALTVVMLAFRKWRWAAFGLTLLIANAFPLVPYLIPAASASNGNGAPTYKLLTTNVLTSNRRVDALVSLVESEDPDFIVLMEINDRWSNEIEQRLGDLYPHRELHPREHNFGIGILSKHPWQSMEVQSFQPIELPWLQAQYEIQGKDFELTAVHPLPPINHNNAKFRNDQLEEVTEKVDRGKARIITGDFNMTPWSPWFRHFTSKSQTTDAARGYGITRTWQVFPTIIGGLKIDHALVSKELNVTNFRVGPSIGSDHRPIIVDFQFQK